MTVTVDKGMTVVACYDFAKKEAKEFQKNYTDYDLLQWYNQKQDDTIEGIILNARVEIWCSGDTSYYVVIVVQRYDLSEISEIRYFMDNQKNVSRYYKTDYERV